jgi:hypothetical protein
VSLTGAPVWASDLAGPKCHDGQDGSDCALLHAFPLLMSAPFTGTAHLRCAPLQLRGGDLVKIGGGEDSAADGAGDSTSVTHAFQPSGLLALSNSQ